MARFNAPPIGLFFLPQKRKKAAKRKTSPLNFAEISRGLSDRPRMLGGSI
jgi:hypothetical protein